MPIAAAFLIANLLTVWFVWGAYHAFRRTELEIPALAYAAMLIPLGIAILALIGSGAIPG